MSIVICFGRNIIDFQIVKIIHNYSHEKFSLNDTMHITISTIKVHVLFQPLNIDTDFLMKSTKSMFS